MLVATNASANQAPQCEWHTAPAGGGTRRQRLLVGGRETPFFVDSANGIRAHKTQGDEHSLWGAGMAIGAVSGRPLALCLGSGGDIRLLKHRAEQMALAESVS